VKYASVMYAVMSGFLDWMTFPYAVQNVRHRIGTGVRNESFD